MALDSARIFWRVVAVSSAMGRRARLRVPPSSLLKHQSARTGSTIARVVAESSNWLRSSSEFTYGVSVGVVHSRVASPGRSTMARCLVAEVPPCVRVMGYKYGARRFVPHSLACSWAYSGSSAYSLSKYRRRISSTRMLTGAVSLSPVRGFRRRTPWSFSFMRSRLSSLIRSGSELAATVATTSSGLSIGEAP